MWAASVATWASSRTASRTNTGKRVFLFFGFFRVSGFFCVFRRGKPRARPCPTPPARRRRRRLSDYKDDLDKDGVDCVSKYLHRCFSIQLAQQFEYNFAHIIDKPFESLFGFIHVLPGAFSGYRWAAISKQPGERESILDKYLETQLDPNFIFTDLETANKFLAEDRILCLGIYARKHAAYTLKYLPDAYAQVDAMISLKQMMGQRKRWINGTWFALNYVISHACEAYQSQHCFFSFLLFYASIMFAQLVQVLAYLAISIYFSVLYVTLYDFLKFRDFTVDGQSFNLFQALIFTYVLMVGILIFYSSNYIAGHRDAAPVFYTISTFLGLYMLFSFILMAYSIVNVIFLGNVEDGNDDELEKNKPVLQLTIGAAIIGHLIPILFNLSKSYELLNSLLSYMFFAPSYIHLFFIYAFCRVDDLSWGTKGQDKADDQKISLTNNFFDYDKILGKLREEKEFMILADRD